MRKALRSSLLATMVVAVLVPGCDTSSSGSDKTAKKEEMLRRRLTDEVDAPHRNAAQRARQIVAERYRDHIVPGLGCDICPNHCKLLDLRRPSHEEFRRVLQQIVLDGDGGTNGSATSPDPLFDDTPPERLLQREINMYEHNRLTCVLRMYDELSDVLIGFYDPSVDPRVRLEAAHLAVSFGLEAGDPLRQMYLMAKEGDETGRMARRLVGYWEREGLPPTYDDRAGEGHE